MTKFSDKQIGISGIMRVKDEAKFIELSVDSCIEALDELVIVYQDSKDETPVKIKEIKDKYPNKVFSYHYTHKVYSHDLSDSEYNWILSLPEDSGYLLSTYYNFALSKAKFKYAIKIDADQIYNCVRLKEFCDAYRSVDKVKIPFREKLSFNFINFIRIINNVLIKLFKRNITFTPISHYMVDLYQSYVIKAITNSKNPVSFFGINLNFKDGSWLLPVGDYSKGTFPPFNGVYDHMIFPIGEHTYYRPSPLISTNFKYKRCVIEKFEYDNCLKGRFGWISNLYIGGFLWYHVAPLKQLEKISEGLKLNKNIKYKNIKKSLSLKQFSTSIFWYKLYWDKSSILSNESSCWESNLNKIKRIIKNE